MTGRTSGQVLGEQPELPNLHMAARSPATQKVALTGEQPPNRHLRYEISHMADDWPHQSYLKLGAFTGAVPCARLHARLIAHEWNLGELAETAELLVSELITNAVNTSQAIQQDYPVRLWLLSDKTRMLVLVWDGNPAGPVLRNVSDDAEGGRGLVLVDALSSQWSWYAHPQLGGKVVWCEITPDDLSACR